MANVVWRAYFLFGVIQILKVAGKTDFLGINKDDEGFWHIKAIRPNSNLKSDYQNGDYEFCYDASGFMKYAISRKELHRVLKEPSTYISSNVVLCHERGAKKWIKYALPRESMITLPTAGDTAGRGRPSEADQYGSSKICYDEHHVAHYMVENDAKLEVESGMFVNCYDDDGYITHVVPDAMLKKLPDSGILNNQVHEHKLLSSISLSISHLNPASSNQHTNSE